MKKILGFLLFLAFSFQAIPSALATRILVHPTDDVIANDGRCSLREAIRSANLDGFVFFENGFIVPSQDGECAAGSGYDEIIFSRPTTYTLALQGQGEDDARFGDLDITSSLTITVRHDQRATIDGNELDRIFHINPNNIRGMKVTLQNLDLTRGNPAEDRPGGAIFNEGSNLTIKNCTFQGNSSETGGGIWSSGLLVIQDSQILGNSALADGGGISSLRNMTMSNTLISDNTAGKDGGGIMSPGTMTITQSTVSGNRAGGNGGGAYTDPDDLDPSFQISIQESTFSNNIAGFNIIDRGLGGAIYNVDGQLEISSSTISNNNSGLQGGGLLNSGQGNMNLFNATISSNESRSSDGGGIYNEGTLDIQNATIVNNAAANGGGLFNFGGGSISLRNTLLAENTVKFDGPDCNGEIISNGFNIVANAVDCNFHGAEINGPRQTDQVGEANNPLIKIFAENLLDNGGLTKTHALVDGIAINRGSCFGSNDLRIDLDQRGFPRGSILNNNVGLQALDDCDVGAFEFLSNEDVQRFVAWLGGQPDAGAGPDAGANPPAGAGPPAGAQPPAAPLCGNAVIEAPPEACDDGNNNAGDGCDDTCNVEAGYMCDGSPSVCNQAGPAGAAQQAAPPMGGQVPAAAPGPGGCQLIR